MLPQRINTIAELQAEQDRLVANMRMTRKEFVRSAGETSNVTKDFLLKNILLPASAIGLGVFLGKQIAGRKKARRAENGAPTLEAAPIQQSENDNGWFAKMMLIALPFVQQFFLKKETENEDRQQGSSPAEHDSLSSLGWLAPIVTVTLPLLQQFFLKKEEESKEHIVAFDENGHEVMKATPKHGAAAIFEHLYKLLPIVLPLVQQHFASGKQEQQRTGNGYTLPKRHHYAEATA